MSANTLFLPDRYRDQWKLMEDLGGGSRPHLLGGSDAGSNGAGNCSWCSESVFPLDVWRAIFTDVAIAGENL